MSDATASASQNAPTYLTLVSERDARGADARLDGDRSQVVFPTTAGKAEFAATTDVVFVNGIGTDFATERRYASQYAEAVHGPVRMIHAATRGLGTDIETCAFEKFGFANNPPERSVMAEVLDHVHDRTMQGDVHFAAHSRGALIVQRGLEMLEQRLIQEHFSKAEIANVLHHVTVETFGGASVGMPPGVRCVNYVSAQDSVANVFGMGKPNARDTLELAAAGASLGTLGVALETKLYADREGARPNGPVVVLPAAPAKTGEGQLRELLENHAIGHYLPARQPFELTYERWHDRRVHMAVENLKAEGVRMPSVTAVEPWNGRAAVGSILGLEDGNVAMHVGRGKYVTFDVANELGGVVPAIGRVASVTPDGTVREDERSATIARG